MSLGTVGVAGLLTSLLVRRLRSCQSRPLDICKGKDISQPSLSPPRPIASLTVSATVMADMIDAA